MLYKQKQVKPTIDNICRAVFFEALPERPYCSNSLEEEGLYRKVRSSAAKHLLIQPNPAAMLKWLVFDVDMPGAAFVWEKANLPPPNFVVVNPKNAHAHLVYALEAPVCRTEHAHLKPLQYAAAIEFQMKLLLRSDMSYAGLICKNPLHEHWRTMFVHNKQYSLDELAEYLTKLPVKLPKKAEITGLGRNCTLFDRVRKRGYSLIKQYKPKQDYSAFERAIRAECECFNATFDPPLPESEVKSITKSISKWIWKHFDVEAGIERTRKYKAACGSKKGKNKREVGLYLLAKGEIVEVVAENVGVSVSTVYRWQVTLSGKNLK